MQTKWSVIILCTYDVAWYISTDMVPNVTHAALLIHINECMHAEKYVSFNSD